jgi:predicted aspartyl protease
MRARRLIATHLRWRGGIEALSAVRTLSLSGTLAGGGVEGTLTVRMSRPGWLRYEVDLEVVSKVEVVGPAGAWVRNFSGHVEALSGVAAERIRRQIIQVLGPTLLGDLDATMSDRGSERRDGRSWRVLRWNYPDGDFLDLLLDPADGSCTWAQSHVGTSTYWTRMGDVRLVSGLRAPFEVQTFHDDPRLNTLLRWHSVEINRPFERDVYARPTPVAADPRFLDAVSDWIPADLVEARYAYVKGVVNGSEQPLLLDSGAEMTAIAPALAGELKLGVTGAIRLEAPTGAQDAGFATGVSIRMGSLLLPDLVAVVTDLGNVERAMGRVTPVILGKEVFNALVVDLDYPRSRISFRDPAGFAPPADAHGLSLIAGSLRAVEVSIEGLPPAPFRIDTGSGSTLVLYDAYTREHGLLEGRSPRSERLYRGAVGATTVTVATLKRIALGGFEVSGVPAEFHHGSGGLFDTGEAAGTIGAGLLQRFRALFDFGRGRMYLVPGGGREQMTFPRNRAGIQADFRGDHLEVVFVAPGSPAEKAGWKVGEQIRAIDGHTIGADYPVEQADWAGQPAATSVRLTDGREASRELILADYY